MNKKSNYYAHSSNNPNKSDWQTLPDHLYGVGELAKTFASIFGAGVLGQVAGLLHDLGKYSPEFQRERLEGGGKRVDHATAGAKIAMEKYGSLGKIIAFAVAGHHAGLANGIDEGQARCTLQSRLNKQFGKELCSLDQVWESEIELPDQLPLPDGYTPHPNCTFHSFQIAFFTRMLFSCLIDGDRLDTEKYVLELEGKTPLRGDYPTLNALRDRLNTTLQSKQAEAKPSVVNTFRSQILQHSRAQAHLAPGLFSMTVPTGGGKTLSSMAFALDHALAHNKRCIIYVIPFTSIIEQNANVFREAFQELGDKAVLEHHSAFDDEKQHKKDGNEESRDKLKLAMENWEAPVVVTTAVQFFESLFSDRTSQCRKLHNIANSVIVLDEAQVMPLQHLRPIVAAIDELARNYGCSIVLCTATQPALLAKKGFYNGFEHVREIAPEPEKLYEQLKRVSVKHIGEQSDEELVEHLKQNEQVLMIVNNRRHARVLYEVIKDQPGAYLLTTLICPTHRRDILEKIRKELNAGRACRVVSTSLIEAGVDISFPLVLREECGLDSIAQAAGRCNREGIWNAEDSWVYVFQSPDWKSPPELAMLAGDMRSVVRNHSGDLLAQSAITQYFQQVYWNKDQTGELDNKQILKMHRVDPREMDFPFQNIARDFRMIESHMHPIIIPFDKQAENLVERLWHVEYVGSLGRDLQHYIVQVPHKGFERLLREGVIENIAPEKFGDQFWVLRNTSLYTPDAGLSWDDPTYMDAEQAVVV